MPRGGARPGAGRRRLPANERMLLHQAKIKLARHASDLIGFLHKVVDNKWKELELDGPISLPVRIKACLELLDRGGLPRTVLQQITADTTTVTIDASAMARAAQLMTDAGYLERFRVSPIEAPALPAGYEPPQLPSHTEVPSATPLPPVAGGGAAAEAVRPSEDTDEENGSGLGVRRWDPDDLRF